MASAELSSATIEIMYWIHARYTDHFHQHQINFPDFNENIVQSWIIKLIHYDSYWCIYSFTVLAQLLHIILFAILYWIFMLIGYINEFRIMSVYIITLSATVRQQLPTILLHQERKCAEYKLLQNNGKSSRSPSNFSDRNDNYVLETYENY